MIRNLYRSSPRKRRWDGPPAAQAVTVVLLMCACPSPPPAVESSSDDAVTSSSNTVASMSATDLADSSGSMSTEGSTASSTTEVSDSETTEASTSTTASSTDDTTTGEPPNEGSCDPLPAAEDNIVVAGPEDDLPAIIANATSGSTVLLEDGTYDLSGSTTLVFATPSVTLRSQSGNPEAVVLDGAYALETLLDIRAGNVTIGELTLQRATLALIRVSGGSAANALNTRIHRMRLIDPGQRAIRIDASPEVFFADDGTVACSEITLTAQGRASLTDEFCTTNAVEARFARNWIVRDNHIEGFWCEGYLAEPAVRFWSGARDTLVERNHIVDCGRGIGFGFLDAGASRDYGDDPCPLADYVGHFGGTIRNNAVVARGALGSSPGFDTGIALEQACETLVYHNTVVAADPSFPPFSGIDLRFPFTDALVYNNLSTDSITVRDGAVGDLQTNIEDAGLLHFVDPSAADVHLLPGSSAIDLGTAIDAEGADADFDEDPRDAEPDIGADEYVR